MAGLRIAVDGRELEGRPTGVGRYLAGLLRAWLRDSGDDRFEVHLRDEPAVELPSDARLSWRRSGNSGTAAGWWQQVVLPAALESDPPDVLFAPSDSMPLRFRGASIVTVHDLSYYAHPEWFGRLHGARRRWMARLAARRATRLIAVSEFTKHELVSRLDVPAHKIDVVLHGCDEQWSARPHTPEPELRERIGMRRPFALVVGSIFERRATERVIEAFGELADLELGLVIVGDDRRSGGEPIERAIERAGLEGRAKWLRYCNDRDLLGLYRAADQLIYVSEYEGFGLPPLEAMALGVPVVVSDRPALNEIYRDSAVLVTELDAPSIAAAVRGLHLDRDRRRELIRRGHARVDRLGLAGCAARTLELIREAARR